MADDEQAGPDVTLRIVCTGCKFLFSEYYACQSDSGFKYECMSGDNVRLIGYSPQTPTWCPYRVSAVKSRLEMGWEEF